MLYLIQKHNATHLHYDLRLEMDGKLRSWAIPKTPPTEKGIKRLAIQTEDHSVEYADFEGIISDEDSGDGSVEIWDKGHITTALSFKALRHVFLRKLIDE